MNALLTFIVLFGIALVSFLSRGIQRSQGGDMIAAALITLLWTVDTIPHLLMISLLFGTVLAFARASADREIIAIRAAGISALVPMAPAILLGIGFALLASVSLHSWIPYTHFHKFRVIPDIARQLLLNLGAADDQMQLKDRAIMVWNRRDAQDRFHDVVIYSRKGLEGRGQSLAGGSLMTARLAWLETDPRKGELALVLEDVRDPISGRHHAGTIALQFDLHELSEQGRRDEGDKDMASDQLLAEVARDMHENPGGALFTVERRSGFAWMPLLLAPIGFCIGVLARNAGRVTALCFAMVPLLVYYLCDFLSLHFVRRVDTPLWGWFPPAVTLALGLPFCWKVARS